MRLLNLLPRLTLLLPNALAFDSAADYNAIRNTLATYPLAIDSKDFGFLSKVFTKDIVANYSEPLNVLTGVQQVETVLQQVYDLLALLSSPTVVPHPYRRPALTYHQPEV